MEVKMQYLADLDDVPEQCENLLYEFRTGSSYDIQLQIQALSSEIRQDQVAGSIENIERIRKNLYRIDRRLGDISNILEGYVRVKSTPEPSPVEQDQQERLAENIENYVRSLSELSIPGAETPETSETLKEEVHNDDTASRGL